MAPGQLQPKQLWVVTVTAPRTSAASFLSPHCGGPFTCAQSPPDAPGAAKLRTTAFQGHATPSPLDPCWGQRTEAGRRGQPWSLCSPRGGLGCAEKGTAVGGVGSVGSQ